ncbi:putative ABC transport system permease protein [Actinopolyspora biskrensis]|uniref:Putative ABC transport system permease protein n=1 Tax=Actinopolyspora biskrensis TaxID=1470178 RepID=A0A852Z974_9ACTN|nr:ABC transporter permease [Actinopolyspora biskrensis]NYH79077.1 putative ABC transport system permease protein [Actinopolyspora biskrensis]
MWRWARLTRRRSGSSIRRTLGSLVVLTILVSALAGVASGARSTVEREVLRAGGSTRIELSAIESGRSVRDLDTEGLDRARGIEHVENVIPDYVSTIYTGSSDPTAPTFDLTTHSWRPSPRPSIVRGEVPQPLQPGQLVVPARSGDVDFTPYVGGELSAAHTEATGERSGTPAHTDFTVVATYDPAWQLDGPDVAYVAPETAAALAAAKAGVSPEQYRSVTGALSAVVSVTEQRHVPTVTHELRRLGFSASPVTDRMNGGVLGFAAPGYRIGILVVLATAVLTGSLNVRSGVRDRLSERAVLRLTGDSVSGLRRVLLGEAMLTGLLAGVLGSAVGVGGALLLRGPLEGTLGLEVHLGSMLPNPLWAAVIALAPAVGSALGAFLGGRVALRRDPRPQPSGRA